MPIYDSLHSRIYTNVNHEDPRVAVQTHPGRYTMDDVYRTCGEDGRIVRSIQQTPTENTTWITKYTTSSGPPITTNVNRSDEQGFPPRSSSWPSQIVFKSTTPGGGTTFTSIYVTKPSVYPSQYAVSNASFTAADTAIKSASAIKLSEPFASKTSQLASVLVSSSITPVRTSAAVDSGIKPGPNQNMSKNEPKVVPTMEQSATTSLPQTPRPTVNKPIPGRNQPQPTMEMTNISSFIILNALRPSLVLPTPSPDFAQAQVPLISTHTTPIPQVTLIIPVVTPNDLPNSSAQSAHSSLPSSTPTSSSFLAVTPQKNTLGQASSTMQTIPTPQAITAAQSLSLLISSTTTSTLLTSSMDTTSPRPSVASASQQGRMTPLARTLFIVFGVLGKHSKGYMYSQN